MNLPKIVVVFSIICFSCKLQAQQSRIEIVIPSIEQEATSIWNTINDISFFKEQGYLIHLPEDPLIDSLILKSEIGSFGNDDFPVIYRLVERNYYEVENYETAKQKVEQQLELLNGFIHEIESQRNGWDWTFQLFDSYQVLFTLYGTGGSYDPEKGIITLFTNEKGEFMKYENPAYTIIHEITHMGMEQSIVLKHQLSHELKERVVDTFVSLMFQEKIPGYQIQKMGDEDIHEHLKNTTDIESLNAILTAYTK